MGIIADKIRKAIFGGDVRDSIADGIEVVEQLREDYDKQVINAGNSNAEIVDARGGHIKLKDRLDQVDSHLEHKANQVDLEVEKARIDLLTKIENGETDGNSELLDIRVDARGFINETAGETVREIAKGYGILDGAITPNKTNFVIDYSQTQILNYSDLNIGTYYSANDVSNPNKTSTNSTYATIKLKLEKGKKYVLYALAKDFTFYIENDEIVKLPNFPDCEIYDNKLNSGLPNDTPCIFTCPTNDYIYITVRVNLDVMLKPMIFRSDEKLYLKEYKEYGFAFNDYIKIPKLKIDKNNILTVKKDGTGDFEKIVECVNSINDSSITNQYFIHIYDGVYDILNELGGNTWLNSLTSEMGEMQGLLLPDYVHLIGHGTVKFTFRIPDEMATSITVRKTSTINLNKTNTISGIEFIAKNCRYAIHDECGNKNHNITRVISNCRAIHEGVKNEELWSAPKALGGGTGSGGNYNITNLYCESPIIPFSYHNNGNQGRNNFNIEGLITKSTTDKFDYDVSFGYYMSNNVSDMNYIYAKNCILSKTMIVKQETQSTPSDNVFTLYKFNVLENQNI